MPGDDPDRALAVYNVATALFHAGRYEPAVTAFREALDRCLAAGDGHAAAMAKLELARALQYVGPPRWELEEEAAAALEAEGPSPDLVYVLGQLAYVHMVSGRPGEAIATADRAIDLAGTLGLPPPPAAYAWRGSTRCILGDAGGLEDLRTAITLATAAQTARDAAIYRNEYLASVWTMLGGPEAEAAALDLIDYAASRGLHGIERLARLGFASLLMDQGRIEAAEAGMRASLAALEAVGDVAQIPGQRGELLRIANLRGDGVRASALASAVEADPHLGDHPNNGARHGRGRARICRIRRSRACRAHAGDAVGTARKVRRAGRGGGRRGHRLAADRGSGARNPAGRAVPRPHALHRGKPGAGPRPHRRGGWGPRGCGCGVRCCSQDPRSVVGATSHAGQARTRTVPRRARPRGTGARAAHHGAHPGRSGWAPGHGSPRQTTCSSGSRESKRPRARPGGRVSCEGVAATSRGAAASPPCG